MGLLLVGTGAAQAQDYGYEILDGTVTITAYWGGSVEVRVPDNIEGLPVVRIGDSAFEGRGIIGVWIPDSVTSLGDRVFQRCWLLTDVYLNHGLTSIGDYAFDGCSSLTSITIPASVTSIDGWAFSGCRNLTSIEVATLNPAYSSLQGVLFNKAQDELISYPAGMVGRYRVPDSVISIREGAFYSCEGLSDVTIPESVTSIGESAFQGCRGLSRITIPHGVTTIAARTFSAVPLTSITIGKGVTSIGDYAFYFDERTKVYFHGGLPSFGRGVFSHYLPPTLYYLPNSAVWGSNWGAPLYGAIPTVLWNPLLEVRGIQGGEFLLHLRGALNIPVLVEANSEPLGVEWIPLYSGGLTNGSLEIPDPDWSERTTRFYRVRSP